MASAAFLEGKQAARDGKARGANPYTIGQTKSGVTKLSEEGIEWDNGWVDGQPPRVASAQEMAAYATVDVSRFRRRPNEYCQ